MLIDRRTFIAGAVAAIAARPDHQLISALCDRLRFWHLYRIKLPPNPVSSLALRRLIASAEPIRARWSDRAGTRPCP